MIKRFLLVALFAGLPSFAFAACPATFSTINDSVNAQFKLGLLTDANGNCDTKVDYDTSSQAHADAIAAIPGLASTAPTTNSYGTGTTNPVSMDLNGNLYSNPISQYPAGATPETASATGTTAATTATLATAVGKTTFICGFSMRSVATAAAAGNATVTGTITGTLNFTHGTGATPTVIPNDQRFNPCIPASTTNTSIAVVSPAAGTGGVMSVTAWGYLK